MFSCLCPSPCHVTVSFLSIYPGHSVPVCPSSYLSQSLHTVLVPVRMFLSLSVCPCPGLCPCPSVPLFLSPCQYHSTVAVPGSNGLCLTPAHSTVALPGSINGLYLTTTHFVVDSTSLCHGFPGSSRLYPSTKVAFWLYLTVP